VSGIKKWIFIARNEEEKLRDGRNQLPFSINEDDLNDKGVKYFVLMQEANDAIFVPSQWYHQVENLTDVLSINHNWFNSCNISIIMDNLKSNFEDVRREIADCSDMENFDEHCQLMLKSLFGLNFEDFIDILVHIGEKRLYQIQNDEKQSLFDNSFLLGHNHAKHDLQKIYEILDQMTSLEDISPCLRTMSQEMTLKINQAKYHS
jgi:hypothetical protein